MSSQLSIYDLTTGAVETVLRSDEHFEAPNWKRDGSALIVNSAGRLYLVRLSSPDLEPIETGAAIHLNNDHGVSPDGRLLVVTDDPAPGEAALYTLAASGGAPTRVTQHAPSYWHGWSPDGDTLAYVGRRGDTFQVFTCPVQGGPETLLTHDFDHCDGPDYTPDGQWIWFNGEREGRVQLWRMNAHGGSLQRMTDDERVNWFPHPSPDGSQVVYLSYESGTRGHPAMRKVELRIMPCEGGPSKSLLRLIGGQGTLNVPSWAPDGRRFAFVSYD